MPHESRTFELAWIDVRFNRAASYRYRTYFTTSVRFSYYHVTFTRRDRPARPEWVGWFQRQ